jgi:hypothetical protein
MYRVRNYNAYREDKTMYLVAGKRSGVLPPRILISRIGIINNPEEVKLWS